MLLVLALFLLGKYKYNSSQYWLYYSYGVTWYVVGMGVATLLEQNLPDAPSTALIGVVVLVAVWAPFAYFIRQAVKK